MIFIIHNFFFYLLIMLFVSTIRAGNIKTFVVRRKY